MILKSDALADIDELRKLTIWMVCIPLISRFMKDLGYRVGICHEKIFFWWGEGGGGGGVGGFATR